VGEFTPEWLALREPADAAARSRRVTESVARATSRVQPLHVVDLGSGAGSNLRFLVDHLGVNQRWTLLDHDPVLLHAARAQTRDWAIARGLAVSRSSSPLVIRGEQLMLRVDTRYVDLATLAASSVPPDCALVTASALCDLVSAEWIRSLAERCAERRAAALLALTYDGRLVCDPEEPDDALVRDLANAHQRTHREFGPALGADATDWIERCFVARGYRVARDPSDWILSPGADELQRQLIAGWAAAACEMSPSNSDQIRAWERKRLQHVDKQRSQLIVGHQDIGAWPQG
jgi:hypothetical protein